MQNEITLYHYWRSSCSWRVRWALAFKNIPYRSVAVNLLKGEQRSPEYLRKNPAGLVPCLEFEGKILSESGAIIEWLEEIFPEPSLLPRDPWDRARVREFTMLIAAGIQPLQNLKVLNFYSEDVKARETWARHFIESGLATLETKLQDQNGPYCFGADLTLADIYLIPQIYNALRFSINLEPFRRLEGIYRHCLAQTACDAAAPHNQPGAQV